MNNRKERKNRLRRVCVLATLLAGTTVTALAFMTAFVVTTVTGGGKKEPCGNDGNGPATDADAAAGWPAPSYSQMGRFSRAAVAADNGRCSEIGRDVMIKGGNAVDAAIAATICTGVMSAHSSGIGGGHFMTIYNRTTNSCLIIDARERAPASATWDMYVNISDEVAARGWNSIAVPGEIYGLWKAYELAGSGRVKWYDLLKPTVDLCRRGFVVSGPLARAVRDKLQLFLVEPTMKYLFYNNVTGRAYHEGEIMTRPTLADTLEALALSSDPIELFYRGEIAKKFMRDFELNNATNITAKDFADYVARIGPSERPAITAEIGDSTNMIACGPPPPSSAAITISVLKIMAQFHINSTLLDQSAEYNLETYHRFIEAMKYAYAAREYLGDMDFLPDALELARNFTTDSFAENAVSKIGAKAHANSSSYYIICEPTGDAAVDDHGTAHVSTLDVDGNAVSITSTINLHFGSIRRSVSTDIIWNDDMDDFSTPGSKNSFGYEPSKFNYIEPGKRPLSSMTPIILYDKDTGDVRMVAGAAGGSRIISATATTLMRMLWFGENVKEAVDAPRLHNQLNPLQTAYEKGFPKLYVDQLIAYNDQNMTIATDEAAVCAIERSRSDNGIYANSDYRKAGGYPAGF